MPIIIKGMNTLKELLKYYESLKYIYVDILIINNFLEVLLYICIYS